MSLFPDVMSNANVETNDRLTTHNQLNSLSGHSGAKTVLVEGDKHHHSVFDGRGFASLATTSFTVGPLMTSGFLALLLSRPFGIKADIISHIS